MTARDPWEAMKELGASRSLFGIAPWMLVALLTHTGAVASPQMTLMPMRQHVTALRAELNTYFGVVDVDVVADEAPPLPAKEEAAPEPEPEPTPAAEPVREAPPKEEAEPAEEKAPADKPDDPYPDEPPPAAAQAADVLNSGEEQAGEDLSNWTMVHKEGSKVTGGGYTSGEGTAENPVRDPRASSKGKAGGRGKADGSGEVKSTASAPAVNRSRAAMPQSRNLSDCPFPPQADMAQIDRAVVDVTVTVDPSGRPIGALVVGDPGHGFGSQAKRCALGMRYDPALSPTGEPIAGTTPILRFRFNR
ncbi:MAG: hypothetical protein FJ096_21985 [Deltaproteobacteria bacterium]|nr:hypothetical protein [Deltaproteobacteria bacterium]